MEYIGILQEYLECIPLYSQNPTQNETIFAKKTIFSGILRNTEYIPWSLAYEEYSEWSTPRVKVGSGRVKKVQRVKKDTDISGI